MATWGIGYGGVSYIHQNTAKVLKTTLGTIQDGLLIYCSMLMCRGTRPRTVGGVRHAHFTTLFGEVRKQQTKVSWNLQLTGCMYGIQSPERAEIEGCTNYNHGGQSETKQWLGRESSTLLLPELCQNWQSVYYSPKRRPTLVVQSKTLRRIYIYIYIYRVSFTILIQDPC